MKEIKCFVLPVNAKLNECFPVLEVNGQEMKVVTVSTYLGDVFNSKGNNKDLMQDRVSRGTRCLVSAMSMVNDVTLGCYTVQVLVLLYKTIFIPSMLFNSETWTRLSKNDYHTLEVMQMKFLKRIVHVPSSTSNCITLLEFGVLPIRHEISIRKMNFLHHILGLDGEDPVQMVYKEQGKFEFERNWHNEVKEMRKMYSIEEEDQKIASLSKEAWKNIVKKKVTDKALIELESQRLTQSRGSNLPPYGNLKLQEYLHSLSPCDARNVFKLRAGVLDIKSFRHYQYEDEVCRLCEGVNEDTHHILNVCRQVERTYTKELDPFTEESEDIKEIAKRVSDFLSKVKEKET